MPDPTLNTNDSKISTTLNKKTVGRQMSIYESQLLELQKKHLEARILNEKRICEKELEILDIKKNIKLLKLQVLQKTLNN